MRPFGAKNSDAHGLKASPRKDISSFTLVSTKAYAHKMRLSVRARPPRPHDSASKIFHHEVRKDHEGSAAIYPQIAPISADFLGSLGSMWPIFRRSCVKNVPRREGKGIRIRVHSRPFAVPIAILKILQSLSSPVVSTLNAFFQLARLSGSAGGWIDRKSVV